MGADRRPADETASPTDQWRHGIAGHRKEDGWHRQHSGNSSPEGAREQHSVGSGRTMNVIGGRHQAPATRVLVRAGRIRAATPLHPGNASPSKDHADPRNCRTDDESASKSKPPTPPRSNRSKERRERSKRDGSRQSSSDSERPAPLQPVPPPQPSRVIREKWQKWRAVRKGLVSCEGGGGQPGGSHQRGLL